MSASQRYIRIDKNHGFKIREFESADIEKVVYINRVSLPENYSLRFFMEHHEKWPKAFLVAEVDGEVVGYVMCRVELGWGYCKPGLTRKGHVVSIAVLEGYRRRGIGKALMEEALKALSKYYKASEVYLEVRVSNYPAISLYEKLGFMKKRILKGYYLDGEDAYVMARPLPLE